MSRIEKWDSVNKEAWIWVEVPSISTSIDTVLYIYYYFNLDDNSADFGDVASTPAQQVWTNGFVSVQHFSEGGDGDTSPISAE